jgi:hypothetical protein
MEFVWRSSKVEKPVMWQDYYNDFIAANANRVIESIYDLKEGKQIQNITS